jgi:TonB family protein
LLLLAIWGGSRFTNESPASPQTTIAQEPAPTAPSAPPQISAPEREFSHPAAGQPPQPPAATSSSVLNEVLPTVPDKIRGKIQGRVYVTVRVLVDSNGNVIAVLMENAGPSKYFARLSDEAARQWKFIPADTQDQRVWLIRFQYARDGVAVRTTGQ